MKKQTLTLLFIAIILSSCKPIGKSILGKDMPLFNETNDKIYVHKIEAEQKIDTLDENNEKTEYTSHVSAVYYKNYVKMTTLTSINDEKEKVVIEYYNDGEYTYRRNVTDGETIVAEKDLDTTGLIISTAGSVLSLLIIGTATSYENMRSITDEDFEYAKENNIEIALTKFFNTYSFYQKYENGNEYVMSITIKNGLFTREETTLKDETGTRYSNTKYDLRVELPEYKRANPIVID